MSRLNALKYIAKITDTFYDHSPISNHHTFLDSLSGKVAIITDEMVCNFKNKRLMKSAVEQYVKIKHGISKTKRKA